MLDNTIDHMENKLERYKKIDELLENLNETGDVDVFDHKSSYTAEIHIYQEEITESLEELIRMLYGGDRVEYIHEKDRQHNYKLSFKIKSDP